MPFLGSLASGLILGALKPPLEKLADYIFSKIELVTEDKLRKLERTLLQIQSLIDQLEGKPSTSNTCRILIQDFKGIILDSDDLLKELHDSLSFSISDVTKGVKLFNELEAYFISEVTKPRPPNIRRGSCSQVDTSSVIKLEERKEQIKLLLAAEDMDATVISIVGTAGIGKTTLAQLVFNDPEIVETYDMNRWWVCVSWEYDLIQITKSIIEAATRSVCTLSNPDSIMGQLKMVMLGVRFLLVLDDMWNDSPRDWGYLKLLFSSAVPGSGVLVTTRSTTISSIVTTRGDRTCISLSPTTLSLSNEDCWEIIKKQLKTEVDDREDLKAIGLKLAERCKGLPLAAKVIGDALHFKLEEVEWDALLKCLPWDLPEDQNEVYRVLKPSYDHLPAYLIRCFVYFSIIPQSKKVKVDDLIRIWAAEGFIGAQGERRIEDIGRDYLKELCSRSFLQISSENEVKMDDFIHDLATSVSTNLCLHLEDTSSARYTSFSSHQSVRYLSLLCQKDEPHLKELHRYKKLRTFMLFHDELAVKFAMSGSLQKLFHILKWLRVLNLRGSGILKLPGCIDKLKRLRYLDLSSTAITELPEEIIHLAALETLQLEGCIELKQWPKGMEKMVKLRHLHFDRQVGMSSMPINLRKLTCLETLRTVFVGMEEGYRIEELKDMNSLRGYIEIKNLENVGDTRQAEDAKLSQKQYLQKLKLQWNETRVKTATGADQHEKSRCDCKVLKGLEPHYGLKELEVKGYYCFRFSDWVYQPSSAASPRQIEKLVLSSCPRLTVLSSLNRLTSLKTLEIIYCLELTSLPERGLPSSLETLSISESGIKIPDCKDGGLQRETVKSIRSLTVDGEIIPTAPFQGPY